jgi:hypothetical protein
LFSGFVLPGDGLDDAEADDQRKGQGEYDGPEIEREAGLCHDEGLLRDVEGVQRCER